MKLSKFVKKLIAEQEQGVEFPFKDYHKLLSSGNYATFVKKLSAYTGDPKVQKFLNYGLEDGALTDDKVKINSATLKCSELKPTQNEIDIDKSLFNLISGKFSANSILDGGPVKLGLPIITYNGEYIIDGHHRWSQVYCFNPSCTMTAIDLSGPKSWTDALKYVQLAIAADLGTIPINSVSGKNLFKISQKSVKKYVIAKSTDAALTMVNHDRVKRFLQKIGFIIDGDSPEIEKKKALAEYIAFNVNVFKKKSPPPPGAPKRDFMPQTGEAPRWDSLLSSGNANIKGPYGIA